MFDFLHVFITFAVWVLVVYHLVIYHKYVGWGKCIWHLLIIPVLPFFISRLLHKRELNSKDIFLLRVELFMVWVLLLSFSMSFAFAIVDTFDLLPFRVSKYDPRLPATKIIILMEDKPVTQSNVKLLKKIQLDMNYDFIKQSDMDALRAKRNIEMDYRDLWSMYMEKIFLSSLGEEGVYFAQVKDANLPFVELVLPRIAKRFEDRSINNSFNYIKTKEGKKEYSIQIIDKWIPGDDKERKEVIPKAPIKTVGTEKGFVP